MRLQRRRGWYRMPDYPFPLDWEFVPDRERDDVPAGKDGLLTADQMARVLNVHVKTLRRWVLTGQIACIRIGYRIRFDRDAVLRRLRPGRKLSVMAKSSGRRLSRGMFRRGKAYYVRDQRGGRNRRVSLGRDYAEAMCRYSDFMARGMPAPRLTVAAAAGRWLETYIATRRTPRDQRLARTQAERYLEPFLGHMLLGR